MSASNKITVKSFLLAQLVSFARSKGSKDKEPVKFRVSENKMNIPFMDPIEVKSKTNFQVEISIGQVKILATILKHTPDQDITIILDAKKGIIIDKLKLL